MGEVTVKSSSANDRERPAFISARLRGHLIRDERTLNAGQMAGGESHVLATTTKMDRYSTDIRPTCPRFGFR